MARQNSSSSTTRRSGKHKARGSKTLTALPASLVGIQRPASQLTSSLQCDAHAVSMKCRTLLQGAQKWRVKSRSGLAPNAIRESVSGAVQTKHNGASGCTDELY